MSTCVITITGSFVFTYMHSHCGESSKPLTYVFFSFMALFFLRWGPFVFPRGPVLVRKLIQGDQLKKIVWGEKQSGRTCFHVTSSASAPIACLLALLRSCEFSSGAVWAARFFIGSRVYCIDLLCHCAGCGEH